jgi:hypothetical protein
MFFKAIPYFLLFTLLFACNSKTEEEKADVFEIRNIGVLATSEYTVGKVVRLKDDKEWYKFGDRSILISCKAKIKGGVNLSKISENDIVIKGKTIQISLNQPEIVSFDMDPNHIRTELEDINGFRMQFSQAEKNEILSLGEKSIREDILQTGILDDAERNARRFIIEFYKQLGYQDVQVIFKKGLVQEFNAR